MLIVDINTLCTVSVLYFGNDILLNRLRSLGLKNILRIFGSGYQHISGLDLVSVVYETAYTVRNSDLFLGFKLIVGNYYYIALLFLGDTHSTVNLGDKGAALRSSCLEKLLNTRKTLCDILGTRYTAGMEGTHRKLCTRLAYRLSGDNSDRLADIYRLACSEVSSVALSANAVVAVAGKH